MVKEKKMTERLTLNSAKAQRFLYSQVSIDLKTHKVSATTRHAADKLDWGGHIEKSYYHGL